MSDQTTSAATPPRAQQPSATPASARRPIQNVREALGRCRGLYLFAALFGVAVNILMLTGPLYMLQIYDRVLTSASLSTLAALTGLVVAAYLALSLIDAARNQVVAKAGLRLERLLSERLVRGSWTAGGPFSRGADLLRDVEAYRAFAGGPGMVALMDLPFTPLFVAVIFLLHPWLGVFSIVAILLLTSIALAAQLLTRQRLDEARAASLANSRRVLNIAAAGESVRVMGMTSPLADRWRDERDDLITKQAVANDIASGFKAASKAVRFMVQSLILGLGALLVLNHEMSPGGMIAASIILGRALSPIEQALGAWSQYNAARAARGSINAALKEFGAPASAERMSLPRIVGEVTLERVGYHPAGSEKPIIADISFKVPAGKSVGIIGPSGVGKSTLARLIVGALEPTSGVVRFDGADIRQIDPTELGRDVGYLSQDVALLNGSIRDNISRFQPERDAEVIEAARRAGVHEMILRLPQGYDTLVGERGWALSAGQRQRVGLARAIFGDPRVVVLDEPNSNLDEIGERALREALQLLAESGATVFVVTHRRALLEAFDALLALSPDRSAAFGPRDKVLEHLQAKAQETRPRPRPVTPIRGEA